MSGFGEFGKNYKPVINNDEYEPQVKKVQSLLTEKEFSEFNQLTGKGNASKTIRQLIQLFNQGKIQIK